ncbi:MAG: electron transfer flavoprotein subunit beta/FixA family protein [Clostridia bacterium]|jgi:electron transfer flavoprotein beta subunit|nr:electron transfer flavoprotein subunit beta/FixA family protein [Clostridia bacterium]
MEILVCVKQVPDDSVKVVLNGSGQPAIDKIAPVANAFDTYALEMAARFKEANGGTITAVSIGPDEFKTSLKNCLAVGADKAYVVTDASYDGSDSLATAYVLSKAVAKIEELEGVKFDIIFCGKETTDSTTALVGPELAEKLGVGVVTCVTDLTLNGDKIDAKQETEEGYNTIEVAMPAVLTINKPHYDPRYPTMKSKMAARRKQIPTLTSADLGTDASLVGAANSAVKTISLSEPPKKQAGIKINEKTFEETFAKAMAVMTEAKIF